MIVNYIVIIMIIKVINYIIGKKRITLVGICFVVLDIIMIIIIDL